MAISLTVRDIENYPAISKVISIDIVRIIPAAASGDEEYVASTTTSAYSDNTARTAIQDIYVRYPRCGWSRSSGFVSAPFTITPTRKHLKLSIDGSTYREVALTTATGISGDALASDIQTKINDLADTSALEEGNLSFKNADVVFANGKFKVVSGAFNEFYTGSVRTSVNIIDGATTTGTAAHLGFDFPIESSALAAYYTAIRETIVASTYTTDTATLAVSDGTGFATRDCCYITDGTNTEYFTILNKVGNNFTVSTNGANSFTALQNSYDAGSRIQLLKPADPDGIPNTHYQTIDSAYKKAIDSLVSQIDFSS